MFIKKTVVGLFLFSLQVWIVVKGQEVIGKEINPFLLLADSLAIAIYYFYCILLEDNNTLLVSKSNSFIGFGIGLICTLILIPFIKDAFNEYLQPGEISDVIPQLKMQYN